MRRNLLALVLLLPMPAFAAGTLFWPCESTTPEFSAGDTSATATSGASISASSPIKGANSCLTDGTVQEYYELDPASIVTNTEGAVGFLVSWATATPSTTTHGQGIEAGEYSPSPTNDYVGTRGAASGNLGTNIRADGQSALSITTSGASMSAGTTYFVVSKWDVAGDRSYIGIYNGSTCALIAETENTATDLAGRGPASIDGLRLGNASGASTLGAVKFDTVIAASDYDDPVLDACPWTSFFPTFTAALSAGSIDNSSIQVTYTPDQPGTAYGVACPDGQTANSAQIRAGNCSGGAAADSWTETGVAGVGESKSFTGLAAGTRYDIFVDYENRLGGDKASVSSLANQDTTSSGPAFSDGPTVTPTANGFTIAGTLAGGGTLTAYAVWCNPGDADPNATEAKAGQCGGGNAAIVAANEVWTTTVANDFALTAASKPVRANVFVVASDGSNNTSVTKFADQDRTARAGYLQTVLTSCSGICALTDEFDPDMATGDVIEYKSATDQSANCYTDISAAGSVVVFDHTDGLDNGGLDTDAGDDAVADCAGPQSIAASYQDVSKATDGCFVTPAAGCFSTDDSITFNNTAPVCTPEEDPIVVVLTEDEAMDDIQLDELGGCHDDDSDALTAEVTSGTLPNGTSQSGTGDLTWGGTPDTEDESGESIEVTVSDPSGGSSSYEFTVYTVNTWTVGNYVGMTASEAAEAICTAAPWRCEDVGLSISGLTCDAGTAGLVLTQDPAAAAEAEAFDPIEIDLSRRCGGKGRNLRLELGIH